MACHRMEAAMAVEKNTSLDERIARACAELEAKHGPGPFDCNFCGLPTKSPCELSNCMRCQNFGYYPPRNAGVQAMQAAEAELAEMREHGNADDATEAVAHLERVRFNAGVQAVGVISPTDALKPENGDRRFWPLPADCPKCKEGQKPADATPQSMGRLPK